MYVSRCDAQWCARARPYPVVAVGAQQCPGLWAGCPAAVANLWDVTDRDVDRFSRAMLASWGLDDIQSKGRGRVPLEDSGSTLRREPVRGGRLGPPHQEGEVCLARSVSCSRAACRLGHLIGAAPVCYGIPVRIATLRPHCNSEASLRSS